MCWVGESYKGFRIVQQRDLDIKNPKFLSSKEAQQLKYSTPHGTGLMSKAIYLI